MNKDITFGQIVKERRNDLGLTQAELARRVGCAAITIRKIEADALRPSVQVAELLAIALNIPEADQLGFVRLARADPGPSPIPTPAPAPEEIGQEDLSGRAIRGFHLGELIGTGGFGVVYKAVQTTVEREVAVKIILPKYANHPDFIRRFESEAQIVARLEHPFVVPLYDYWREPNAAYLIMRLLRGGSLEDLLKQGPLSLEQVNQFVQQIGLALDAAHRAGIIHRDIKPANILLDEDDNAYLADFGIAKDLIIANGNRTEVGGMVGSPAYISPEQIRAEPVKLQADIYCLGITLFELLTGQKPFAGPTPAAYIQQHLQVSPPSLFTINPHLPPRLDEVIQQAIAKNPAERYPNVMALLEDFQGALPQDGIVYPPLESFVTELSTLELSELENPFKGLRPFREADAADFYGRDTLIQELLTRLAETDDLARFLAVVGPSGSGKSSVVRAGLIPALRRGGLPHSDKWFIVEMMPGSHPFEELEAALLRIAVNPPESLLGQLRENRRGLLRAVRRILPADSDVELLLVIDQFEEIFTLVQNEETRAAFLDCLVEATLDERSRLRLVVTLRADFVDRPLQYVDFGELVRKRSEFVLPLTADELEQVITQPITQLGMAVEPKLVASIVREVGDQPGTLPLLQYALTELFERREGAVLTRAAYASSGGVLGALGRRADEIYDNLDASGQEATRQLFLRLVTLGEGVEDTRRRVLRSELESVLITDYRPLITEYGRFRLLTFDHDPATREPTVEVAHEALLRDWGRLREWLVDSRNHVRQQRVLAAGAREWEKAHQDPSYLLHGTRLAQFEDWVETTTVALTHDEQVFLQASIAAREQRQTEEEVRRQRELATAQQLAETERQRAKEQEQAAVTLRRRAAYLGVAALVAMVLAVATGLFSQQSSRNEAIALDNAATAVAAGERADAERDTAILAQEAAQAAADARATAQVEANDAANAALMAQAQESTRAAEAASARATSDANASLAQTREAEAIAQQEEAQHQTRLAESRALAAESRLILEKEPVQSLLLATQAMQTTFQVDNTFTEEAYQALFHALNAPLRHNALLSMSGISSAVFSPDGERILTANHDNTARLWDKTGIPLVVLEGHTDFVTSAVFSKDGNRIFTTSSDGTARLWDKTGTTLAVFEGHSDNLRSAEISPDGVHILTVSDHDDNSVRLWDENGVLLGVINGHTNWISSAVFSPGGETILTASADRTARMWDIEGNLLAVLEEHSSIVDSAVFSPNGLYIVTASSDNTARIWDNKGNLLHILEGHTDIDDSHLGTYSAGFSPDGKYIFTTGGDGIVRLWDINGNPLVSLGGSGNKPNSVTISSNGKRILVAYTLSNFARLYDDQGNLLASLGHSNYVGSAVFNPDETRILTASSDGTAQLWDGEGSQLTNNYLRSDDYSSTSSAEYSADGKRILFVSPYLEAWLWDVGGSLLAKMEGHTNWVNSAAFDSEGTRILTAGSDNTARLWDGQGNLINILEGHDGAVVSAVFSPDGMYILTASRDGTARLWDEDGNLLTILEGHDDNVELAVFSPDGMYILTASWDNTARLWDREGNLLYVLQGHTDRVVSAIFSPDGTQILTTSLDNTARLWDLSGHRLAILEGASSTSSAFSPNGTQILTARGNTAQLWDQEGNPLAVLEGHTAWISSVEFSPNGEQILTASNDSTARLWGSNGESLAVLELNTTQSPGSASKNWAIFSPNGQSILTINWYSSANLWVNYPTVEEMISEAVRRIQILVSFEECITYLEEGLCNQSR